MITSKAINVEAITLEANDTVDLGGGLTITSEVIDIEALTLEAINTVDPGGINN